AEHPDGSSHLMLFFQAQYQFIGLRGIVGKGIRLLLTVDGDLADPSLAAAQAPHLAQRGRQKPCADSRGLLDPIELPYQGYEYLLEHIGGLLLVEAGPASCCVDQSPVAHDKRFPCGSIATPAGYQERLVARLHTSSCGSSSLDVRSRAVGSPSLLPGSV